MLTLHLHSTGNVLSNMSTIGNLHQDRQEEGPQSSSTSLKLTPTHPHTPLTPDAHKCQHLLQKFRGVKETDRYEEVSIK